MKVRCILSKCVDLTPGKIYKVNEIDEEHGWYGVTDDSGDSYWYDKDWFEVVKKNGSKKADFLPKSISRH